MTALPIDPILPELVATLRQHGRAVLQAPPGAGKTTRVPLALLEDQTITGKILMLEPRRLAARAAAERMANTLGQQVGDTVGYRMRGASKSGPNTRIEVVTEGILTAMIQSDPELTGISVVIFDEFHERSLNADLGLALAWDIRGALREDLRLLVMSATLDAAPVAQMLDAAPIVTSEGKSFPVDIRHLPKPTGKDIRLDQATCELVVQAITENPGSALVFLPGEGEIKRTEALLAKALPSDCTIAPLYGALPFAQQQKAIQPTATGRKIVLATAIAETSLTIQGIRIVVDAGRARRARYDAGSGMSRLVTERVSRAEATQRTGRAGRVAAGVSYRLWTKGEEGSLPAFPPAEIEAADLTGLALELARWGSTGADLALLTAPPEGPMAQARALLHDLGALDTKGAITAHGRALVRLPLHPRLAHMVTIAGPDAAPFAALLNGRDVLMRGAPVDLSLRLEALRDARAFARNRSFAINHAALAETRAEAQRLRRFTDKASDLTPAQMLALAYPDRIGQHRKGDAPRYILSGGKGAYLEAADPLARSPFIVASDLDGDQREAKIRAALPISYAEICEVYAATIAWHDLCEWSKREGRVITRQQLRLGAIALEDRTWSDAPPEDIAVAMLDGVRQLGLSPSNAAKRFVARVEIGISGGLDLPDLSEAALMDNLEAWLLPHLTGVRSAADWKGFDLLPALKGRLDWGQTQALDKAVPSHFTTPMGRRVPIDYSGDHPAISLRLGELYGVTRHPTVGKTPLRLELLSPAQRPIQITLDLPNFWKTSYADVRKDMRAQYPKHPWPEDPTAAEPTLRAKPRKS
ncbi:ATP-dependent helicase HrpB [Algirhabdus cladophorae]|uniref:ATP-dependent helicase HrpB n=1 Tax=Algirhabdus cladophorae TaxID=3377108 RepID=UPI003B84AE0C